MYPLISQSNLQILVNVITDLVIILSKLRFHLFLFHFTLVKELITNYSKEKNYVWFILSYCMSWEVQFPWALQWEFYCSVFFLGFQKKLFMKVKLPFFQHYLSYQSILNACPSFSTRLTGYKIIHITISVTFALLLISLS